jgi:hypothetical protein
MKRLFVLFALGLGSMVMGTAASAQSDAAMRYATCLVQIRPDEVRALLQATNADAANRPYHALADDNRCFSRVFGDQQFSPNDASFSMDVLRGRLAEEELLNESAQVSALQPLPLKQKRYIRPWFAATGRHPAVDEMAACMADTDPAGIEALIRTEPGNPDENAAIAAMAPNLGRCLGAGTRLDASRQALRAALADALYQRVSNPSLSLADASDKSK